MKDLPDFPFGVVISYENKTIAKSDKDFESKEDAEKMIKNELEKGSNIIVYKFYTKIDEVTKKDTVCCRYFEIKNN